MRKLIESTNKASAHLDPSEVSERAHVGRAQRLVQNSNDVLLRRYVVDSFRSTTPTKQHPSSNQLRIYLKIKSREKGAHYLSTQGIPSLDCDDGSAGLRPPLGAAEVWAEEDARALRSVVVGAAVERLKKLASISLLLSRVLYRRAGGASRLMD